MKSEILTLCEYASEHNGRLTIIDTFDSILATKFPWRAYFSVASKIDLEGCEIDFKTLSMRILKGEDTENPTFETQSPFSLSEVHEKLNLVASFKGLIFDSPGEYNFIVSLDDTIIAKCTFKVVLKKNE